MKEYLLILLEILGLPKKSGAIIFLIMGLILDEFILGMV